jgi:uncharacterized protein
MLAGDLARGDADCRIFLRDAREVPLRDGRTALLAFDSRKWVALPNEVLAVVKRLHGVPYSIIAELPADLPLRTIFDRILAAGLVELSSEPGGTVATAYLDAGERPKRALLLKLVGGCNIACTYCYDYDPVREHASIDVDFVKSIITQLLSEDKQLSIVFHGGEPLMHMKAITSIVDFCESQADGCFDISFGIQSNGLLLTQHHIDYFQRHMFDVGISLDGPIEVNDKSRVDHRGRGTFARLFKIIEKYPDFMRNDVGYISVQQNLSRDNLKRVFAFFADLGTATLKILPVEAGGRVSAADLPATGGNDFIEFLNERIDAINAGDGRRPYLVNIVELIDRLMPGDAADICLSAPCGAGEEFIVIDAANAVRACDVTYNDAFKLWQPGDSNPAAALQTWRQSPQYRTLRSRRAWLGAQSKCRNCDWLNQCGGSCPGKALERKGTIFDVDDIECATRLALFPKLLDSISRPGSALLEYYWQRHEHRARRKALQRQAQTHAY